MPPLSSLLSQCRNRPIGHGVNPSTKSAAGALRGELLMPRDDFILSAIIRQTGRHHSQNAAGKIVCSPDSIRNWREGTILAIRGGQFVYRYLTALTLDKVS